MIDNSTCGWIQVEDGGPIAATGPWAVDLSPRAVLGAKASRNPRQWAGLLVVLAVSSFSSIPDPWIEQRRQFAQPSMANVFQRPSRRRLSAAEARQMALEVLYRAEEERAMLASEEARRGINWEEIA